MKFMMFEKMTNTAVKEPVVKGQAVETVKPQEPKGEKAAGDVKPNSHRCS